MSGLHREPHHHLYGRRMRRPYMRRILINFILLAALPVFAQPVDDTASRDHFFPLIADGGVQLYEEPLAPIQVSEGDESFWAARTPMPLRTASEVVILDPQGTEVLRETLPNL